MKEKRNDAMGAVRKEISQPTRKAITASDEQVMKAGKEVMKQYKKTFEKLAKN